MELVEENEAIVHRFYDELKRYVEEVRTAFPDWHNNAQVQYAGAAFFRLKEGLIEEAWVVGDTQDIWRALGVLPARTEPE